MTPHPRCSKAFVESGALAMVKTEGRQQVCILFLFASCGWTAGDTPASRETGGELRGVIEHRKRPGTPPIDDEPDPQPERSLHHATSGLAQRSISSTIAALTTTYGPSGPHLRIPPIWHSDINISISSRNGCRNCRPPAGSDIWSISSCECRRRRIRRLMISHARGAIRWPRSSSWPSPRLEHEHHRPLTSMSLPSLTS